MTEQDAALKQVVTAASKANRARHELEARIRDAHALGATVRAIATAAGLSVGKVHQIIRSQP